MPQVSADLVDFPNIFSLKGKVVVITGGSRGLGLAAASGVLQAGASKVYISSRSAESCEEACKKLNSLPNREPGAEAISVPADASQASGIKQLAEDVSKTTDHVDILLANAGVALRNSFDSFTEDQFADVLNLNVTSVFLTIQAFKPLMTKQATRENTSRVIVTSSVSGVGLTALGEHANFPYAAAKAGVIHLVKQLAVELGPENILTNSISPGFFPTDLARPFIEANGGEEVLAKAYPNQRLGQSEDFAATVVYLASRAGGHVNGHNIVIDGGRVIGRVDKK